MKFGQMLSYGEVQHTNPTVVPTQTGKLSIVLLLTNSTVVPTAAVVPCHLQTLQLFPTANKPYSCSQPAEKHDYSAQGRVETHSACLGAWSAEYLIKHEYSAQVRTEIHSVSLRMLGMQNTR